MATVWEQVIGEARLITLPEAYLRLKEVLEQPDFSMADVAMVISQDPALTARLLRLVNSPYYGLSATIETVFRAITMLGTKQVHDLTLATSVTQTFEGMDNEIMDMPTFWRSSVFCGIASQYLAKACHVLDSERLFVSGLLRGLGHLIMYQTVPELCQQAIQQEEETGQPLYFIERELIGLDYARVGGVLMRQWQLPGSLRESTEFHVEPGRSVAFPLETFLVHIAALLTEVAETGRELGSGTLEFHPDALGVTGLSIEICAEIQHKAGRDVDKVIASIFPHKQQVNMY